MFTIADIRNIAIQIECNGERAYRSASEKTADPEMAKIFSRMAEDEKRHAKWFESIQSPRKLTEEERDIEAVGRSILQEMVKNQTFSLEESSLGKVSNLDDLLQLSAGFEQDTILFYLTVS